MLSNSRDSSVVHNDQMATIKLWAIFMLFTIILAPIGIWYLLFASKPTDVINGFITDKRSASASGFIVEYYVTVGIKELSVSHKIFKNLAVGDYISASYRGHTLYSYKGGQRKL